LRRHLVESLYPRARTEREREREERGRKEGRKGKAKERDIVDREKRKSLPFRRFLSLSCAMRQIRGLSALVFIVMSLTVEAACSEASPRAAAEGASSVVAASSIEARRRHHHRLAASSRRLLDAMPWDTVVDQPSSVATTVKEKERGRGRRRREAGERERED